MRSGSLGRIAVLMTMWVVSISGLEADAERPVAIELRYGARAALPVRDRRVAEVTAGRVLALAGIDAVWRHCPLATCADGSFRDSVIVGLLPISNSLDAAVSGETVHDARTGARMVLVYVPRIVELVDEIRRTPDARTHPALATIGAGDLVGLTIAHEVGHVLGLSHAPDGVMKARPSLAEIVALRAGSLAYRDSEVAQMRRTLLVRSEGQLARGR